MTYKEKKEWETEKLEEFKELTWKDDIIPVLQKCYNIAISDVDFEIPYTSVVLKNISTITNKEPMEISFRQWKSFQAYLKHNSNDNIKIEKLFTDYGQN